jgi:hypothetical protein
MQRRHICVLGVAQLRIFISVADTLFISMPISQFVAFAFFVASFISLVKRILDSRRAAPL